MFHNDINNSSKIMIAFTDGAITKENSSGSSIIGECEMNPLTGGFKLFSPKIFSRVAKHSTNNEAELNGILMAIENLPKNNTIPHLIFSDSEYCIKSLSNWIFNWYKTYSYNRKNGIFIPTMTSSSNSQVKNVKLICTIIHYIAYNNISLRFINVRGHKNPNKNEDVIIQADYYKKSNNISINEIEARFCCLYNMYIDKIASDTSIRVREGVYDSQFNEKTYNLIKGRITVREHNEEFNTDEIITFKNEMVDDSEYNKFCILNHAVMEKYKKCIGVD